MQKVADPELTPSARVLRDMRETGESFFDFAKRTSLGHRDYFRDLEISPDVESGLEEDVARSLDRQREIDETDEISFEEYLERYYSD